MTVCDVLYHNWTETTGVDQHLQENKYLPTMIIEHHLCPQMFSHILYVLVSMFCKDNKQDLSLRVVPLELIILLVLKLFSYRCRDNICVGIHF